MQHIQLTQFEISDLETRLQALTDLPWKFERCHMSAPRYMPIFSFYYYQPLGPEDQEERTVVRVHAQSNGGDVTNLYGFGLDVQGGLEALQILAMVNDVTPTTQPQPTENDHEQTSTDND